MRRVSSVVLCLAVISLVLLPAARAEDDCCLLAKKAIAEAQDSAQVFQSFVKAAECFFRHNQYAEFCACVRNAAQKDKRAVSVADYCCALGRYHQLKHLEDKQLWDEYFAKGNEYRDEIADNLQKVFKETRPQEPVHFAARLLAYRFHKDMEDSRVEEALAGLMTAAKEFSKKAQDSTLLKDAAIVLEGYNERGKAKELYTLYINRAIAGIESFEELNTMAQRFLNEGNLELAETVFDVYIGKLAQAPDRKIVVAELARIASTFVYKDTGLKDPAYAEKVFAKIEELEGKQAFSEELLYLRGYNLERAKEWASSRNVYADFLAQFGASPKADKVTFKLGVLSAYCLRDLKAARDYFQRLGEKEKVDALGIAGLYQLGLLAQWENDANLAKGLYTKILEKSGSNYPETTASVKQRMKEIEEGRVLDPRIKDLLDASLLPEYVTSDMSRVQLAASKYNLAKGEEVSLFSTAVVPESGCMQVNLEYFWAGDLGSAGTPEPDAASLTTSFKEPGTKVIGLIVKTPAGILDRGVDFLDVE